MQVVVAAGVRAVCDLYEDLLDEEALQRSSDAQLRLLADRLAEGPRDRRRAAFVELHNWPPRLGAEHEEGVWSARLRERGADVRSEVRMYGGGATALSLLRSSSHPPGAEHAMTQLDRVLVEAGAAD